MIGKAAAKPNQVRAECVGQAQRALHGHHDRTDRLSKQVALNRADFTTDLNMPYSPNSDCRLTAVDTNQSLGSALCVTGPLTLCEILYRHFLGLVIWIDIYGKCPVTQFKCPEIIVGAV